MFCCRADLFYALCGGIRAAVVSELNLVVCGMCGMKRMMAYFALRIPVVMAVILLSFAGFSFLLNFFGYVFVLFHVPAILFGLLVCGFMFFLACMGVGYGKEQTKVSRVFAACLPVLALMFFLVLHMEGGGSGGTFMHAVLSAVALVCSMMLFFACTGKLAVKIGLGIPYGLVMIPVFLLLLVVTLGSLLPPFGLSEVRQTVYSPGADYRAEIITHSQGALGGNTQVFVTPNRAPVPLLVGELQVRPRSIYFGRWGEFDRMSLRFEREDRLYLYRGPDRIVFERTWGNRWVRR